MATPMTDDFKWFGEGFEGFPRVPQDSTVEYSVYFLSSSEGCTLNAKLEEARKYAVELTHGLLADYIWHVQGFTLDTTSKNGLCFLHGTTSFGDSIEDEWVVVYVLRELSRHFPEAWVQLTDTDGDFLLIEAADVLPRWLTPESSENRVWMRDGKLHLISSQDPGPSLRRNSSSCKGLTTEEAISCLRNQQIQHCAPLEIEALRRLQDYPAKIGMNQHHAIVRVPRKLALVLREYPASVSQAINAFYLRDPIALRPLRAPNGQGLRFPAHDLVLIKVKFNRVGFAQLRGQSFDSPRTWKQVECIKDPQQERRTETGMKLTSGFEMLLSDPQTRGQLVVRSVERLLEALADDPQCLPRDTDLADENTVEDDEGWMDIDYGDFEKEVGGNGEGPRLTGFGDQYAQANLRRMAARLESLLHDDETESTEDDSEGSTSSDGDSTGAGAINANKQRDSDRSSETELMAIMQEVMGPQRKQDSSIKPSQLGQVGSRSDKQSPDLTEIEALATAMEAELREAGGLN